MTDNNGIHSGSLQFYPRVRAKKIIPSVNWKPVKGVENRPLGFIGYKVGMISVWARDNTENSLTKGKRIAIPATVVECPAMRIYSVRYYKDGKVAKEVVVTNDKVLKKNVKLSKTKKDLKEVEDFDDVRIIIYTLTKNISVDKNKPDMLEIALSGTNDEKLAFIKEKIGKDILASEVFDGFTGKLLDVRAVTKGYGTQGPVRRFGIALKDHKSEKGRRRPGSLAPWHPSRVTFRAPQAGQTGYHQRISYNHQIIKIGNAKEEDITPKGGFEHYGRLKTEYLILNGSLPGPKKRGLVLTHAMKPGRITSKKKFEVLEIR